MQLQSFAQGYWQSGDGPSAVLRDAATGEAVAEVAAGGLDYAGMLAYARETGGPALRALTFHQRAACLKALAKHLLEHRDEFYALSTATGATRRDTWLDVDGGIATLFAYASRGRRELPDTPFLVEGAPEALAREESFIGQHLCLPLGGAAVHINAFNFPCWGMLEKLATTLLAGVPAIVKPARQTAYLAERVFRRLLEADVLPAGALQLICGGVGDLVAHLDCQDAVSFTGSAHTATELRRHPRVLAHNVRFIQEADSLNCSVLGPEATPDSPEFDLFADEVVREMTIKAGQKCTAIRRVIVPRAQATALVEALTRRLAGVRIGHPGREDVDMGPLVSLAQREDVRARLAEIERGAERVYGDTDDFAVHGADAVTGAFLPPVLLWCEDPGGNPGVHEIEAFGPVATVMPYADTGEAVALARAGQGSLVGSVFSADDDFMRDLALGAGAWHGRLLLVNRHCAAASTGHGSPLPALVHGGPGRAGGGEELGGLRGVVHYLRRCALQGSPDTLAHIAGEWLPGAARREDPARHLFRRDFDELRPGDSLVSAEREVTLADIEQFAALTGDRFYAHMDEAAARRNPFFDGRVAHGYFIVSAAAGLFVDPAPGPVLANYGLENLRFLRPVYPGDRLRVTLTCKRRTARAGEGWGEVCWDARVDNQDGTAVATYDVLTLVARAGAAGDADRAPP